VVERIFLVAPYSPPGGDLVHLSAAKKIEMVARLRSKIGAPVILVNTAHNRRGFAATHTMRRRLGDISVAEITPFTFPIRPIGKVLNILAARRLATSLCSRDALVWIYNGYAYESVFALSCKGSKKLVVEIEDLPFSRRRGFLDVKNRLDSWLLNKVLRVANVVTLVNSSMTSNFEHLGARTILLPSIISRELMAKDGRIPFSQKPYTLGYFGGLSAEKGVDTLLELLHSLPDSWRMLITGAGPLADDLQVAARAYPDRLVFRREVSETDLYDLMLQCDALVNPHRSIALMRNGVFPFKVFEYLVTKRLVFSTALPETGMDIERAIVLTDGSVAGLRGLLLTARDMYAERKAEIEVVAEEIRRGFSEDSVAEIVLAALGLDGSAKESFSCSSESAVNLGAVDVVRSFRP
jgi:glycosyltransferase involved in cell wall biosynthesis